MPYDCLACDEYNRLSRRGFLGASALTVGAGLVAPGWLPRVALARHARSSARDALIVLNLRGGFDALSAVVPYEQAYINARPNLFVPRHDDLSRPPAERCIFLDWASNGVSFGLNPNLARLMTPYNDGTLLWVHACGSTDTSRSHFDAQKVIEVGDPANSVFTGWLGRHLATISPANAATDLRAIAVSGGLPRALFGGPDTLAVPDMSNVGLYGNDSSVPQRRSAIADMYAGFGEPLAGIAQSTFETLDLLSSIGVGSYVPSLPGSVAYPIGALGTAFKQTAALLKAQVGVEAVAIDAHGWDTHVNAGPVTVNGFGYTTTAVLFQTLAAALEAFYVDMLAAPNARYTVVAVSEFGRRLAQNNSMGVDHGWATAMLLMGQSVRGGRVHADWPGMSPGQLFEGEDLRVTTDYRDVLCEVLANRLGNEEGLSSIFPGHVRTAVGVVS